MLSALKTMVIRAAMIAGIVVPIVIVAVGFQLRSDNIREQRAQDKQTCLAINEGRTGARLAITVLRDVVQFTAANPDVPPIQLTVPEGAGQDVIMLIAELNLILAGDTGSDFRDRAIDRIDDALQSVTPLKC